MVLLLTYVLFSFVALFFISRFYNNVILQQKVELYRVI